MEGLLKGINIVAEKLGISVDTGNGYRVLSNISEDGGQEVATQLLGTHRADCQHLEKPPGD